MFTITKHVDGRITIDCQNADQIRDAMWALGSVAMPTAKATKARKAKARKARVAPTEVSGEMTDKIPLVRGSVNWKRVDVIAKQIGWSGDKRQLRSLIVAKRKAA